MAVCQFHELLAVKKLCVLVASEVVLEDVLCDWESFERARSRSATGNLLLVSNNEIEQLAICPCHAC